MSNEFNLGRHEAMIEALDDRTRRTEISVSELNGKMDTVLTYVIEQRAQRRAVVAIAAAAGTLASFLLTAGVKLWQFLKTGSQ